MQQTDIIAFISALPLFSGVPQALLAYIPQEEGFLIEEIAPGSYVMQSGDAVRRLGIVYNGSLEVQKNNDHTHMLINILHKGDLTGATTLFLPDAAAANTLYTKQGCTMLFFTEALLQTLMRQCFALAENYIRYLAGRVRFLDGRVKSIASPTAADKLYNHLLQNAQNGVFRPQSSMTALATTLSLSRASLYRAMEELKAAGLIRHEKKTIVLQ